MNDQEHFDWVRTKWNEHVSKRGLPTELEYPYGEVPITRYLEISAQNHPERPAVNFTAVTCPTGNSMNGAIGSPIF